MTLFFCYMQKKPSDPEVYRLLGEVKYELKDYDGSATAYRNSAKVYISSRCGHQSSSHWWILPVNYKEKIMLSSEPPFPSGGTWMFGYINFCLPGVLYLITLVLIVCFSYRCQRPLTSKFCVVLQTHYSLLRNLMRLMCLKSLKVPCLNMCSVFSHERRASVENIVEFIPMLNM